MAHADDIIVLDDDDDEEEEKPHCSNAKSSPQPLQPATNGKKESGNKSKSAAYTALNNKLFDEFVDYCSNLTVEHPEVIGFLKGRFSKANPPFLSSVEFHNVLGRCLTKVQSKRSKVYVYINELCTALKANSQKRKVTLQTFTIPKPPQDDGEKVEEKTEDVQEEDSSPGKKTGSKRQIRYLENLLRIYSREIQKLQEKELSLDELEDEDSAYIQEARLKRKILRIFQKLCDLKDCSSLTGRVIEQKIPYRGTRYPEVNRRLEKFINGSHDIFPDYNDVLRVILKANDKHDLGLPRKQMQGMAQDAFRELGNRLQERRHLDLVYNFGCHLTDVYKPGNDPAHQDSALQRRLRENRSVSLNRLEDLIKKYAEMQDEGEEEDRKKRRKNDAQSSSKSSSRPTQSPSPESEEEESSEESETDIEDLVNSEEIADGEGKEEAEEEEEEQAVDQETEADQRMELPSDPQPFSSAGEDEEEEEETDKNEEADYEMDEGEEQVDQSTTPDSSPQTNKEESHLSTLELEIEVLPLDRSPCSPGEATSPRSSMDRQSEELKEVSSVESKSEHDGTRHDTESQELKVCENEEENAEDNMLENLHDEAHDKSDVEDQDISSNVNNDVNITADVVQVETDLQADGESCTLGNVQTVEEVSEVKSNFDYAEDDQLNKCTRNASTSFIKRSTPGDGEKVLTQSCQVDADIQCIEIPQDSTVQRHKIASYRQGNLQSKNSAFKKKTASTNSELQRNKSHTKMTSPAGYKSLYIDSYAENDVHEVPEGSRVGSSNGVYHVKREEKCLIGSPFRSNHKNFIRDSPKSKRTNEPVMLFSKRKSSPSQILVKNGKRLLNGSGQDEGKIEKPLKKPRTERYYASPLPKKSDKNNDHTPDITLAMVVKCSPPVSPSSTVTQRLMSNVSTQCDPDEVIVLSD